MTILTTQSRVTYAGDGVSTVFPIPFEFFLNPDITAVKTAVGGVSTTLVQSVDYILAGAGSPSGGFATKTTALLSGETLAIFLNPPIEQQSHYPSNNPFPAATLENDLDRQTQISQRLEDQLSRSLRAPDGDPAIATAGFLLPSYLQRASTLLGFDANGNPTIAPSLATVLTQAAYNLFLLASPPFVATPQEIAASLTIVNGWVPSHAAGGNILVDRYGTNTTPGTTSMLAAAQAAINLAKEIGGVVQWGPVGPYLIDGQLDCSVPVGSDNMSFTIRGNGQEAAYTPNAPFRPGVIFKHNLTAGFDCTGNRGMMFENGSYGTDVTTFPKTAFLLARNTDGASTVVQFKNVKFYGNCSKAVVYDYGCENTQFDACNMQNAAAVAGAKVLQFTQTNLAALASSFTTIATGTQSTKNHSINGGVYVNFSSQADADVIDFESTGGRLVVYGGTWMACALSGSPGRSFIHFVQNLTGSIAPGDCTIRDLKCEAVGGFKPTFGILFDNIAVTPSGMTFEGNLLPNVTAAIFAGASVTCDSFIVRGNSNDGVGGGHQFLGTLQNSIVHEPELHLTIGASNSNSLIGLPAAWTVTSRNGDNWQDCNLDVLSTWTPGLAGLTTLTGALAATGKVVYSGREVAIYVTVTGITGGTVSAGQAISGLPVQAVMSQGIGTVYGVTANAALGECITSAGNILLSAFAAGTNTSIAIVVRYPVS